MPNHLPYLSATSGTSKNSTLMFMTLTKKSVNGSSRDHHADLLKLQTLQQKHGYPYHIMK